MHNRSTFNPVVLWNQTSWKKIVLVKKLRIAAPYLLTIVAIWMLWPNHSTNDWIKGTAPPEWRVIPAEFYFWLKLVISIGILQALFSHIFKLPTK